VRLFRESAENTNQLFNTAARASQPPHGVIPRYEVARLITSPRPISFSFKNPGSLTGRDSDLPLSVVFIADHFSSISQSEALVRRSKPHPTATLCFSCLWKRRAGSCRLLERFIVDLPNPEPSSPSIHQSGSSWARFGALFNACTCEREGRFGTSGRTGRRSHEQSAAPFNRDSRYSALIDIESPMFGMQSMRQAAEELCWRAAPLLVSRQVLCPGLLRKGTLTTATRLCLLQREPRRWFRWKGMIDRQLLNCIRHRPVHEDPGHRWRAQRSSKPKSSLQDCKPLLGLPTDVGK
jgi:hypothetical protein